MTGLERAVRRLRVVLAPRRRDVEIDQLQTVEFLLHCDPSVVYWSVTARAAPVDRMRFDALVELLRALEKPEDRLRYSLARRMDRSWPTDV